MLGFNCGSYDLNLTKEHFVERLADAFTSTREWTFKRRCKHSWSEFTTYPDGLRAIERDVKFYSLGTEAYEMLKVAVVGGTIIVFTRHHEAGVSKLRPQQIAERRPCKRV